MAEDPTAPSAAAPPPAPSAPHAPRGAWFGVVWFLLGLVVRPLFFAWFRWRRRGEARLPAGAFVVAANHASYLDPVVLGLAIPRPITFLVTSSVFDAPGYRFWMRFFGCIRVRDGAINVEALRAARAVLERGGIVGIFPEGGLSDDGKLREGQLGVASFLLQSRVPVVAAAIVGAFDALPRHGGFPKRTPVEIRLSRVIAPEAIAGDLPPKEARRRVRDEVMAAIAEQLPARMGGRRPD